MSIHTILSQMEEFDKTIIELRRYFFSCGVMRVEPKPEKLHEITDPLFSAFATRIVEEVGSELIGEDEPPINGEPYFLKEDTQAWIEVGEKDGRNKLRSSQRTKLQKMKGNL